MTKTTREVVSESQELIDAQNEHDKHFLKPFGVRTGTKVKVNNKRMWELIEKSFGMWRGYPEDWLQKIRRNNG